MLTNPVTATAHPNIALIKYWGDLNPILHIPANGSISMNLAELFTQTTVSFEQSLEHDQFTLDGKHISGPSLERVSKLLSRVRHRAGIGLYARVESNNNFPTGVGMASSASGFAALTLAATQAAGLELDEKDLYCLARTGSGSACRSIPGGFVEWLAGERDEESYAYSIASSEHWDLVDCIAVVSQDEKLVSSSQGHALANTSLLQASRLADAPRRLDICREAIRQCDFSALAQVAEMDSNLMHAVMITSEPALFYWKPETVRIIQEVQSMHKVDLPVFYTVDAGPNVHVLCEPEVCKEVADTLSQLPGVSQVLQCHPGGPARIENSTI